MLLDITVQGDDEEAETRSLLNWLSRELDLEGKVCAKAPLAGDAAMGALLDAITVVLGSGTVAVLGRSLNVWLRQRRADVTIRMKIRDRTLTVDAKRISEENLSKLLQDFVGDASDEVDRGRQ